jgi:hypothetical protein
MTKNRIVTWDTDHDITDLVDELNDAMASVFDGRQCPRMTAVDTGSANFTSSASSSRAAAIRRDSHRSWADDRFDETFPSNRSFGVTSNAAQSGSVSENQARAHPARNDRIVVPRGRRAEPLPHPTIRVAGLSPGGAWRTGPSEQDVPQAPHSVHVHCVT